MARCTRHVRTLTSLMAATLGAVAVLGLGLGTASPARASAEPDTVVDGYGFDICTAPTDAEMDDWLAHSPYQAVGVYIGGPSYQRLSCAHGYTPDWVAQQAGRGWRMWPLYGGAQIGDLTAAGANPAALGVRDAADADADARTLGFGPGTTIFADVEHYRRSPSNSAAVVSYLRSFAAELRRRSTPSGSAVADYRLGVYGSSSSVIADVASQVPSPAIAAVDTAAWAEPADDYRPTTDDANLQPGQWTHHERIHQYYGNHTETYGSTTLSVDANRLDMGAWAATPPRLTHISGPDAVSTAIAASTLLWRTAADPRSARRTAHAAVLARADDFADALSGAALAARAAGPLLLTPASALDLRTAAELTRTLPSGATVYLLGGAAVLPTPIETALHQAGYKVRHLQGHDRFSTAAAAARAMAALPSVADAVAGETDAVTGGTAEQPPAPHRVFLADGRTFPDALAAATAAGALPNAVLLVTDGPALPQATTRALHRLAPTPTSTPSAPRPKPPPPTSPTTSPRRTASTPSPAPTAPPPPTT